MMMIKIFGVILTVVGCGSVGFQIAANHRREEKAIQQLLRILEHMECELQYRLTPLPELCRQVGKQFKQIPGRVFADLALELDSQISPDVTCCMTAALHKSKDITPITKQILANLGATIGKFDLDGQLKGLNAAATECKCNLDYLSKDRDSRLRSYQTLGLCAGAALAILLI